jgi:RNA polymerase sigma-70 factor (ECF subfamily)
MECEKDLIKHIADGATDMFEQIVLKYQNLVYTVCFNILKNAQDAENTAQETFLSAFLHISGGSGEINNFKSWICRVAVNKAIDFKRRNLKVLSSESSLELLESGISDGATVENQIEQNERREKLTAILSNIPEKYANAVKAFYYEQMSVKEIASRYKLPEKTVETHLYRAKKLIKERWGEYEY